MGKSALIQVRIDQSEKESAEAFFDGIGISVSDGVRMFLSQCVSRQRIPFDIHPNPKKAQGLAFGILNSYAIAALRSKEREAWISSLISVPDELIGQVDATANASGDRAYRQHY